MPNQRQLSPMDQTTEFLMYTAPGGRVAVEVFFHNDNIWLPQKRIAELFGVSVPTISEHLKNIFTSGELQQDSVIRNFRTTAADGKNYNTKYYNLDAIISVGYRVNSTKATQFRIWATEHLKEFMLKGFVLDDERLKNGRQFGKDYFQELLERVRSIRANERRIYQKITDIFAECSIDYDKNSDTAHKFYAHVQNKFHFAITGQTASEIVFHHADATKPLMGMHTYKNAPEGRVIKSDAKVAKNYLDVEQIKRLERTVSSFFDYIEGIIERRNTFTMEAFATSVDKFLAFNEYAVLEDFGSISRKQADAKASAEYDEFNKTQRIQSDFDKSIKAALEGNKGDGYDS